MPLKTYHLIHILLVAATIGFSILLFIVCLFFPSYHLSNDGAVDGFTTLLMGWAGLFMLDSNKGAEIGFLGWYANLFFFPAWLGLALSIRFRAVGLIGLVLTFVGVGLALCSVLVKHVLINEGGDTADVTSMGAGFYIWLAGFAVCLLGYFGSILWSLMKPKLMVANS